LFHVNGVQRGKRVTLREYSAYQLAFRANSFNILHRCGKLFQQNVVDKWTKNESNNINWVKRNQATLRVESYQGLMDHLRTEAALGDRQVGSVYILPSTFPVSIFISVQKYYTIQ
jgi:hypothetical protein